MAGPGPQSYVREFTRHSSDVLRNLEELRQRQLLTDVTLRVRGRPLQAHKAVLAACSGFFYSIFLGQGGHQVSVLTLPSSIEPAGFQALLDFMYTSRLLLSPGSAPAVLAAASYLQMEHVVESCHRFIRASYERAPCLSAPPAPAFLPGQSDAEGPAAVGSPRPGPEPPAGPCFPKDKEPGAGMSPGAGGQAPPGQPSSPRGSSSCAPSPDPKACNWKKYRFIVLNSLQREGSQESGQAGARQASPGPLEEGSAPRRTPPAQNHGCPICHQPPPWLCLHAGEEVPKGQGNPSGAGYLEEEEEEEGRGAPAQPPAEEKPYKCHFCNSAFRYKGNLASHRSLHTGEKPYCCRVCGAQFNRPANLKTHLRIHSGEKPFKCETCGSRFVQVAHLRAHVLIHTGEKPYPCDTCGTRFRHLQTLKSHIRIHTGEKPYQCEKCNLRFRHKSQLRLHLRQKHGAITNTKIRYQVLDGPYATLC
ncbi:B-cell CLL/lymphoma 6 member B protein isoform X2 [Eublepharis macularius]|uniref:B-cell CLL/lymphoma 6 member B protein isoform X2 n=1 Tax=Eublepharis macularius TaxID=481883 RepID=A0AA97K7H2_EUBMA|nr:B-cell CLL/lymphoma 6 member B protein isoform X2 [Eublepharis macularius]